VPALKPLPTQARSSSCCHGGCGHLLLWMYVHWCKRAHMLVPVRISVYLLPASDRGCCCGTSCFGSGAACCTAAWGAGVGAWELYCITSIPGVVRHGTVVGRCHMQGTCRRPWWLEQLGVGNSWLWAEFLVLYTPQLRLGEWFWCAMGMHGQVAVQGPHMSPGRYILCTYLVAFVCACCCDAGVERL
jgi:hypothetical protein